MMRASAVALSVAFLVACEGAPGDVIPPLDGATPNDDDADPPSPPGGFGPETPAPSTRLARLTREQWENTVQDLLRLDERTGLSAELPEDALPAGFTFDNPAASLSVDSTQWAGFQRAAAQAAALVTSNPAALALIVPSGAEDDEARARAFIADFGGRAHRRPLQPEEVDRYLAIFQTGRVSFPGVEPFTAGVRLVVEAVLQSPLFLYRVELSGTPVDGVIHLDGYEVASRLSYALWNTMPDDALFQAADDDGLDAAGVLEQARRMLDDDRAKAALLGFHAQLLESEKLAGVAPSAAFFPDAPANLGALARRETELFLEDLFTSGGGLVELLTSTSTFVNEDLARLYGVEGDFGEELVRVDLDPSLRRGIFTQVAFLAQNATSVDPDPIHRGVYLARHMACIPLSAPPADIPPLPPAEDFETNRDRVVRHTESSSPCIDCHTHVINPFGFPFEGYDAMGQARTHDNGLPVNTNATVLLDDAVPVTGAVQLAEAMAASPGVHECYARHWIEFALGRSHVGQDRNWIERLGSASRDGAGIKDILLGIVTSPAFLQRSVEELEGGAP